MMTADLGIGDIELFAGPALATEVSPEPIPAEIDSQFSSGVFGPLLPESFQQTVPEFIPETASQSDLETEIDPEVAVAEPIDSDFLRRLQPADFIATDASFADSDPEVLFDENRLAVDFATPEDRVLRTIFGAFDFDETSVDDADAEPSEQADQLETFGEEQEDVFDSPRNPR